MDKKTIIKRQFEDLNNLAEKVTERGFYEGYKGFFAANIMIDADGTIHDGKPAIAGYVCGDQSAFADFVCVMMQKDDRLLKSLREGIAEIDQANEAENSVIAQAKHIINN